MFPFSLMNLGRKVKTCQPCFEIQDGGGPHLELQKHCFFVDTDVFSISVATFLLNLAMNDQILNNWQMFFENQDEMAAAHLELWLLSFFDVAYVF